MVATGRYNINTTTSASLRKASSSWATSPPPPSSSSSFVCFPSVVAHICQPIPEEGEEELDVVTVSTKQDSVIVRGVVHECSEWVPNDFSQEDHRDCAFHHQQHSDDGARVGSEECSSADEPLHRLYRYYGWERDSCCATQQGILRTVLDGRDLMVYANASDRKKEEMALSFSFDATMVAMASLAATLCASLGDAMVVLLVPSRHRAQVLCRVATSLVSEGAERVHVHACMGGRQLRDDLKALRPCHGKKVVIGTPGRIHDMMQRRAFKLASVHRMILDNVKEMLSMGFGPVLDTLLDLYQPNEKTLLQETPPQQQLCVFVSCLAAPETTASTAEEEETMKRLTSSIHVRLVVD